ncbi:MAG TPA: hypothetical protein PKY25_01360 [Bacilli bacterium]|nr:hypothetical protein [Bacilli bacterium]
MDKQYSKLIIISTYIRIIYDELLHLELENKIKTKEYNYLIFELNKLRKFEESTLNKIYLSDIDFNENITKLKQNYFMNSDNKYISEIFERIENMLGIKVVRNIENNDEYSKIIDMIVKKELSSKDEEYFISKYVKNAISYSIESGFLYLLNKTINKTEDINLKNMLINKKYKLAYISLVLENELILSTYNQNKKSIFIYSNNISISNKYKINDMKLVIVRQRLSQLVDSLKESKQSDYDDSAYKLKLYIIELYIRSLGLIVDIKKDLVEYSNSDNLVANSVIDAIIKLSDEDKKTITDVPPIYKFPKR